MQPVAHIVVELLLLGQIVQKTGLRRGEVLVQAIFKGANIGDLEIIQVALRAS